MALWYFEEQRAGRWMPRTSWSRPVPHPVALLRLPQRGLRRVRAEHETLSLDELAAIYGFVPQET